eukprot:TRINITY_DN71537_c0_g1_i1.p3 TRINITY_DN71537_c0_g1~~TRINITY_DN71537_c0_g1_i1.p3  ORF type:complete len:127 (+),score=39.84 TRINITY_DN71537_c0_g1_i1:103-483(+)
MPVVKSRAAARKRAPQAARKKGPAPKPADKPLKQKPTALVVTAEIEDDNSAELRAERQALLVGTPCWWRCAVIKRRPRKVHFARKRLTAKYITAQFTRAEGCECKMRTIEGIGRGLVSCTCGGTAA